MNPLMVAGAGAVKHSIMRTISVLCVLAVIGLLGLGVKRILYPPKTENYAQTVQAGGQNFNIEVYNPDDKFFLGIKIFGLKLGISKPEKKTMTEVIEEAEKVKK